MKQLRLLLAITLLLLTVIGIDAQDKPQQQQKKNRPTIGLVLGGGGAKGAAHAGALKVIEDSDIPIDYIAGTSIGSIVGGLYACGYRADELQALFRSQEWSSLLTDRDEGRRRRVLSRDSSGVVYVFGFPTIRKKGSQPDKDEKDSRGKGLLRGEHIEQLLDSMILIKQGRHIAEDSIAFDNLPIPFRCVATDIKHHREHIFDSGRLSTAMRASMAIPGAFKSVRTDSAELMDGGLLNNLPVDVVKAMGADIVIAIDLTQNKHEDEKERLSLRETLGIGGLLDWVVSRPDLKKYKENCRQADLYINPDLSGFSAGSFKEDAIDEMIRRGYKAAHAQRKQLRKLKKHIQKSRR